LLLRKSQKEKNKQTNKKMHLAENDRITIVQRHKQRCNTFSSVYAWHSFIFIEIFPAFGFLERDQVAKSASFSKESF